MNRVALVSKDEKARERSFLCFGDKTNEERKGIWYLSEWEVTLTCGILKKKRREKWISFLWGIGTVEGCSYRGGDKVEFEINSNIFNFEFNDGFFFFLRN